MSPFKVFVLFAQAILIQFVMSQNCGCGGKVFSPPSLSLSSFNVNSGLKSLSSHAGYGGAGTGQVGVSGDVVASGNTVAVGAVPVLGTVEFGGSVSALGSVSISGQCGCGCSR